MADKILGSEGGVEFGWALLSAPSTLPPTPPDGRANIYIKDGNFVIQYNDGGTVRYKHMDLTTSLATVWITSTTAP